MTEATRESQAISTNSYGMYRKRPASILIYLNFGSVSAVSDRDF